LRAGDVVTTGTWCGMVEVPGAAALSVRIHGIGEARVEFAA
jgi:2-keto-4-pentenoate hydratase